MTLPLPANYTTGASYTAANENAVEAAVNALGAGTLPIPGYVQSSSATSLTLTVTRTVYVFTGSSAATWTLPAVAAAKVPLTLVNRGTAAVTVQRAGGDQIYNMGSTVTSFTLPVGSSAQMISDGSFWLVERFYAPPPAYDAHARSALKSNLYSPISFTWTQNVGVTSYGLIAVYTDCTGYQDFNPDTVTTNVTFGGVSLTYLGWIGNWGLLGDHHVMLFGGPGVPAGTGKTASVTLTQATKGFNGYGISFTYSNVRGVGAVQGDYGDYNDHLLEATPCDTGPTVMWCSLSLGSIGDMTTTSISNVRQVTSGSFGYPRSAVGDMSVFTTNTVKALTSDQGYAGSAIFGVHIALSMK